MRAPADAGRVARALRFLDALIARFPRLRRAETQRRLAIVLDDTEKGGDRGSDGSEEENDG